MAYNKDTGLYEGFIYCVTNNINNKKYIGQTIRTIEKRWKQHASDSKRCSYYFHNAIKKYGIENFKINELEKIEKYNKEDLKKSLDKLERYYIKKFNTYKDGYNSTLGGDSIGESTRKPVDVYNLDGQLLNTFDSLIDASSYYNVCHSDICLNCSGKLLVLLDKYVFRYHNEEFSKYPTKRKIPYKTVYQFDENGNFIKGYRTTGVAIKELNIKYTVLITEAIREKHKCAGFYWSYDKNAIFVNKYIKVNQFNKNGYLLNTFDSIVDAAKSMEKINPKRNYHAYYNNINSAINGTIKTAYGYVWKYVSETKEQMIENDSNDNR